MDAGSTDVTGVDKGYGDPVTTPATSDSDRQTDFILAEIRSTRRKIAETVGQIGEKLTTESIGAQLIKAVQSELFRRFGAMNREKYSEYGRKISQGAKDTVRAYPGSMTLLGLGLGWFILENYLKHYREDQEMLSPPEESLHTGISPEVEVSAPEQDQESRIDHLKQSARHYREVAVEKGHAAKDQVSGYMDENPLMVGFIGLSVGLIAGVLTSGIFRESELLDEARNTIKEKTRELVRETREKASHIVDVAGRAAREEAERQNLITH